MRTWRLFYKGCRIVAEDGAQCNAARRYVCVRILRLPSGSRGCMWSLVWLTLLSRLWLEVWRDPAWRGHRVADAAALVVSVACAGMGGAWWGAHDFHWRHAWQVCLAAWLVCTASVWVALERASIVTWEWTKQERQGRSREMAMGVGGDAPCAQPVTASRV
jgi:hypothetical protein